MQPTVLAGPIQFSPADIALILAVLTAAALLVTAPGWLVLAVVLGRRPGQAATVGKRWAANVAGALLGIVICGVVSSLVLVVLDGVDGAALVAVLASWGACWAMAAGLRRSGSTTPRQEGWGR